MQVRRQLVPFMGDMHGLTESLDEWEHFLYVGKVAFFGWALHYRNTPPLCFFAAADVFSSAIPHHGTCYLCPPLCTPVSIFLSCLLTDFSCPASNSVFRCAHVGTSAGPLHFFRAPPDTPNKKHRIRSMCRFYPILLLVVQRSIIRYRWTDRRTQRPLMAQGE